LDVQHAKTEDNHEELMARMKVSHERMEALKDVSQEPTEACPEMIKDKETKSEEIKFEAAHEEVPKEEAAVKISEALKKRHGDRHLAVGHREKPKERTQDKSGTRQRKCCIKNPENTEVREEASGETGRQPWHRNRDLRQQLHLGRKRTSGGIYRKALVLEIVKRIAGSSIRIWKMRDWTLWSVRPPPKRKRKLHTEY
jgi:hypothetical protein